MSLTSTKVYIPSGAVLEAQLSLLQPLCDTVDINEIAVLDVVRILGGLSSAERVAFSSVWTTMKLLLVMPATRASSECFFALHEDQDIPTYNSDPTMPQQPNAAACPQRQNKCIGLASGWQGLCFRQRKQIADIW